MMDARKACILDDGNIRQLLMPQEFVSVRGARALSDSARAQGLQGAVHKVTVAALRAYAAGGGSETVLEVDETGGHN